MPSATTATWKLWGGRLLRWVVLPWLVLRILGVIAFRAKCAPFIDAVRGFNKHLLNPAMLHLAGRRGWYAARVEHVGRRSGRRYATPVWAERTPDGFVIPLPYGVDVDWCRNLLAAGGGVLEDDGVRYAVGRPEVVEATAALPLLPPRLRRLFGLYGVSHYLALSTVPTLRSVLPAAAGDVEPRPAARVAAAAGAGPNPTPWAEAWGR
jgi:hypothetical protein